MKIIKINYKKNYNNYCKNAICIDYNMPFNICFYKNYKAHNKYGPAVYGIFANKKTKAWYYKGYYCGSNFTIESWKEKIAELKYLESLEIFK